MLIEFANERECAALTASLHRDVFLVSCLYALSIRCFEYNRQNDLTHLYVVLERSTEADV